MKYLARLFLTLLFVGVTAVTASKVDLIEDEEVCTGLPNGNGIVPHPTYCAFFYFCDLGNPDLMECPTGLYFNPSKSTCDYPDSVPNCEGGTHSPTNPTTVISTTRITTTTQTPEPEPTVETSEPTVSTALPPSTTTPGPEPTIGTSEPEPTVSTALPSSTTTSPGDLVCPPNVEIVFMPYPKDCTKFYECKFGAVTRVLTCSAGLWFRADRQACMTPWTFPCPN